MAQQMLSSDSQCRTVQQLQYQYPGKFSKDLYCIRHKKFESSICHAKCEGWNGSIFFTNRGYHDNGGEKNDTKCLYAHSF